MFRVIIEKDGQKGPNEQMAAYYGDSLNKRSYHSQGRKIVIEQEFEPMLLDDMLDLISQLLVAWGYTEDLVRKALFRNETQTEIENDEDNEMG